jgi:hypothetical protein
MPPDDRLILRDWSKVALRTGVIDPSKLPHLGVRQEGWQKDRRWLEVGDLQGDRSDVRLMMPSARKGRWAASRSSAIPTNQVMAIETGWRRPAR